jgi:hypothetical protein
MPEYVIITKKSIESIYRHRIDLPVDMGASNERLCDRLARQMAENGVVPNVEADEIDDNGEEQIAYVYRNDVQVWPRIRKKQLATKASQIKFKADPAPPEVVGDITSVHDEE